MPRPPSKVVRTTVYRLIGLAELRAAIRAKYFDPPYEFGELTTTVDGVEALLVTGEMQTEKARWAGTVEALVSSTINLGNKTAAAVLLIRDGNDGAWGVELRDGIPAPRPGLL